MTTPTKTLCPYCGVGCGLEVQPPALPGKATYRDDAGTPTWRVRGEIANIPQVAVGFALRVLPLQNPWTKAGSNIP